MSSAFIETASGRRFQPLDPDAATVDVEDIAHALSNQCRYSGHTRTHYSVAEHSVRVSELLEAWGEDRETQLWGLLHDASEAYLVDLPSPLKSLPEFEPYRIAEARLQALIIAHFGLEPTEPSKVREADLKLLATEVESLMPNRPEHWAKLQVRPLPIPIEPWAHETARRRFLDRFKTLTTEAA